MKTSELLSLLKEGGCDLVRHGSSHDIWYSPITKQKFTVPRHSKEMPNGTVNNILKQSGLK